MIEIKEEDIVMDSLHRGLLIQITSKEECKQLKQQILQDHKDVKNLREDRDILLKENNELGSQLQDTAKDRQIIKKIEQWKENLETLNAGLQGNHTLANKILPSLQKILEGKK